MSLRSKLPHIGTTIFTVMSQMAAEEGAINLSQGFPGFGADPVLLDLVGKYTLGGFNQYAPMAGIPRLRNILSEKTKLTQGYFPDPDLEVTIVSGATEAIFSAVATLVRAGDEVIILEPAYDSYEPAILLSGGVPVYVPLNSKDFSVDWEKVKKAISSKTRAILVNSPHNPSGFVWAENDLNTLADLIRDREIYVVSDEVYEHITFDVTIRWELTLSSTKKHSCAAHLGRHFTSPAGKSVIALHLLDSRRSFGKFISMSHLVR
jgi:methionine transaminase